VAEFASRAVDDRAYDNVVLELGGPAAVSPHEVIRTFEQVGGRSFEVQRVPEDALRARAEAATDPLEKAFGAIMLLTARGYQIPMADTLARFPVRLHSVGDYARQVVERLKT
jgi:NADH dehydrogenase